MKVLSLFDGIACGRLALERAGIKVDKYVAYEIEEKAIKIAKKNFPEIIEKGDVFNATYQKGEFDLLIGGSPCTFWSIAKAGQGTRETTASGVGWELFSQYLRALNEVKPKYFLYENNFSMSSEIKECISKELGCAPYEINSSRFSAQTRYRLYWTNIPVMQLPDCDKVLKDILQNEVEEKYYYKEQPKEVDMTKAICAKIGSWKYEMSQRVYNPEHKSPTLTCVSGGHQEKKVLINNRVRKLTPTEYERLQTLPDNYTEGVSDSARYKAIGNGWTVDVIAHILRGINDGEET